jgi:subtilisin family serine protease
MMCRRRNLVSASPSLLRTVMLVAVLWSGAATIANAQAATDTSFSYFADGPIPLIIHLDSLGIYAPGVPSSDSIVAIGRSVGLGVARSMGRGLYIAGLDEPRSRADLVALARDIVALGAGAVDLAGLVSRLPTHPSPMFVTDQFLVEFLPDVTQEEVDSLNAMHGVQVIARTALLENDYALTATPRSTLDALDLANLYHEDSLTRFAHPNFIRPGIPSSAFSNDPLFPDQWHLHNTAQHGGVTDADIDAPEAWQITNGSPNVVVAIVELGGFDTLNVDIAQNLWQNPGETPTDGLDNGDPWVKKDDVHGWDFQSCTGHPANAHTDTCGTKSFDDPMDMRHGTAVAGLAAGRGDNNVGITGVCPTCKMMLLRTGLGEWGTATTLRYAWEMGADVINLSWTGPLTGSVDGQLTNATTLGRGGNGAVVVAATWNNDVEYCTPHMVSHPQVITVSGSDNFDTRSSRTAYGHCLDLLAPGWARNDGSVTSSTGAILDHVSGIVTADRTTNAGYNNTKPELSGCLLTEDANQLDYTKCFSGASAATPIVSGVVGLMLSLDPTLTASDVMDILHRTADKIEYDDGGTPANCADDQNDAGYTPCPVGELSRSDTHGYGRVNAFCALRWIQGATDCAPLPGPEPDVTPDAPRTEIVEVGVRLGVAYVTGGADDQAIVTVPGGGPLARPVLYADWRIVSWLFLEGQLGFRNIINIGNTPDEGSLGAVLQPTLLFSVGGSSIYLGPHVALDRTSITGAPAVSEWGFGGAFGLRFKPLPYLSLRVESLYRNWSSLGLNEVGLAIASGVVF